MIVVFDLTPQIHCYMINHTKTEQIIYNMDCYQTLMALYFTGQKEATKLEELSMIYCQATTFLIYSRSN